VPTFVIICILLLLLERSLPMDIIDINISLICNLQFSIKDQDRDINHFIDYCKEIMILVIIMVNIKIALITVVLNVLVIKVLNLIYIYIYILYKVLKIQQGLKVFKAYNLFLLKFNFSNVKHFNFFN
jgi:hypothetical protein